MTSEEIMAVLGIGEFEVENEIAGNLPPTNAQRIKHLAVVCDFVKAKLEFSVSKELIDCTLEERRLQKHALFDAEGLLTTMSQIIGIMCDQAEGKK